MDKLTVVRWTTNFDYNNDKSKTYFSFTEDSTIQEFTPSPAGSHFGSFNLIAGIPFNHNYLDAKLIGSIFNKSKSILTYNYSTRKAYQETNSLIKIVDTSIPGCTNTMGAASLGVCELLVLYQKFTIDQILLFYPDGASVPNIVTTNSIIVADTENHCIRLLDLTNNIVKTIAGVCGTKGFVDGPLGNNKLSRPSSLGMDNLGYIWIYDYGNRYIR